MLKIDERTKKISLTRGDTAYLTFPLTDNTTGGLYQMNADDTLTLSIKKDFGEQQRVVLQKVSRGTNNIHIIPEDTKPLKFACYKYEVELAKSNGDVFTVIGAETQNKIPEFEILPEA